MEDVTRPYVQALEARGVPHVLVGGKSFHDREEVETMSTALAAIEWPEDELSVFGTLRGSLFAIDDETLFAYRRHARRINPFRGRHNRPRSFASSTDALDVLRRAALAPQLSARAGDDHAAARRVARARRAWC